MSNQRLDKTYRDVQWAAGRMGKKAIAIPYVAEAKPGIRKKREHLHTPQVHRRGRILITSKW